MQPTSPMPQGAPRDMSVQRCGRCKKILPSSSFAPCHQGRDGFWCHSCRRDKWKRVDYAPRPCAHCGTLFTPKQIKMVYCSKKCKHQVANMAKNAKLLASKPKRTCAAEGCDVDITHRRADTIWCSEKCHSRSIAPEKRRKYRLSTVYGITPERYDEMVNEQGDKCAICDRDHPNTSHGFWHIDHCHETGEIRKLLCSTCNTGLGSFFDNPDWLDKAAHYIRSHRD